MDKLHNKIFFYSFIREQCEFFWRTFPGKKYSKTQQNTAKLSFSFTWFMKKNVYNLCHSKCIHSFPAELTYGDVCKKPFTTVAHTFDKHRFVYCAFKRAYACSCPQGLVFSKTDLVCTLLEDKKAKKG